MPSYITPGSPRGWRGGCEPYASTRDRMRCSGVPSAYLLALNSRRSLMQQQGAGQAAGCHEAGSAGRSMASSSYPDQPGHGGGTTHLRQPEGEASFWATPRDSPDSRWDLPFPQERCSSNYQKCSIWFIFKTLLPVGEGSGRNSTHAQRQLNTRCLNSLKEVE